VAPVISAITPLASLRSTTPSPPTATPQDSDLKEPEEQKHEQEQERQHLSTAPFIPAILSTKPKVPAVDAATIESIFDSIKNQYIKDMVLRHHSPEAEQIVEKLIGDNPKNVTIIILQEKDEFPKDKTPRIGIGISVPKELAKDSTQDNYQYQISFQNMTKDHIQDYLNDFLAPYWANYKSDLLKAIIGKENEFYLNIDPKDVTEIEKEPNATLSQADDSAILSLVYAALGATNDTAQQQKINAVIAERSSATLKAQVPTTTPSPGR
jgi:hypothetical protein